MEFTDVLLGTIDVIGISSASSVHKYEGESLIEAFKAILVHTKCQHVFFRLLIYYQKIRQ